MCAAGNLPHLAARRISLPSGMARKPNRKKPAARRSLTRERRITWIDQRPLRDHAHTECGKIMVRLETTRVEWRRYEAQDIPAFEKWKAQTFGALLSRIRETDAVIEEKERIIEEVEMEMMFGGSRSERAAYRRVMHRRAHPEEARREEEAAREERPEPDDFEQEMMFEETMRMFTHIDPDRLDDETYESMFEEFKKNVFGRGTGGTEEGEPPPMHEFPGQARPPLGARVKELYRLLVRRLHPDVRADGSAEVTALWHEVQEAYEAGDVARLETLLALTDVQSQATGDHTTLGQLRAVIAELMRALRALQKSLRQARKEHAWDFSRADRDRRGWLQGRLQKGYDMELKSRLGLLEEIESIIARWAAEPGRRATPKRRATGGEQGEFPL